jgi:type I restriction enzyme S subunit
MNKWKEEEIGNIGNFLRGPFGSSVQKSECVPKSPNTYKLYEQGNVINNDFTRGNYYLTKKKFLELNKFEVLPGDILITCAGTLGRMAIVPKGIEKGIINSVLMRIRLDESKVNKKYFIYFFSLHIQNEIISKSTGVAMNNLFATKQLRKFKIPLPSLKEQEAIVQEIEKQFTRLDQTMKILESVKEKLNVNRKAVLKAAFYGINFPECNLSEVCNKITDGSHNPPKGQKKGKMMLSAKDVFNGKVVFEQPRYISEEDFREENKRTDIHPGDVLLTIVGAIGRTAVVKEGWPEFTLQRSVAVLKPSEKIESDFLSYFLRNPETQNNLKKGSRGTAQEGIYLNKIKRLKIRVPPIKEQQKIVQKIESRFSVIDKIEEIVNGSALKAELLRKSILKSAFEGKLVKVAS